jgi:diguanylate cyclase (GGDEF)-like protein/PAS domain S-box-containing protein
MRKTRTSFKAEAVEAAASEMSQDQRESRQVPEALQQALGEALRENAQIRRALEESEARFHELANQTPVGIDIIEDGRFVYVNRHFEEIFGYGPGELLNVAPLDLVAPEHREIVAENMRRRSEGALDSLVYAFRGLRKDGSEVELEIHAGVMRVGARTQLVCAVLDITERVQAERAMRALQRKLADQSVHDPLTGLFNRRYLEETLERELALAEREGHPVSCILADIDHFKRVNDEYGHLAGDEVLRAIGAALRRNARASDINCRYGGEEFLLVLPRMPIENALARAEQLRATIAAAPVRYGAVQIAVTASFGVAVFPQDGAAVESLIAAADAALYAAKRAGRNRVCRADLAAAGDAAAASAGI